MKNWKPSKILTRSKYMFLPLAIPRRQSPKGQGKKKVKKKAQTAVSIRYWWLQRKKKSAYIKKHNWESIFVVYSVILGGKHLMVWISSQWPVKDQCMCFLKTVTSWIFIGIAFIQVHIVCWTYYPLAPAPLVPFAPLYSLVFYSSFTLHTRLNILK